MAVTVHQVERDADRKVEEFILELFYDESYYYYLIKRDEYGERKGFKLFFIGEEDIISAAEPYNRRAYNQLCNLFSHPKLKKGMVLSEGLEDSLLRFKFDLEEYED